MPPAQRISRALKKFSLRVWEALTSCCGMSECFDEPLLGTKISRGRSFTPQPRRYTNKKRSYLRAEASSVSPTRPMFSNPFDDDALTPEAPTSWNKQENAPPTVQDSAAELPLSTPFRNFNNRAFEVDDHSAPLF